MFEHKTLRESVVSIIRKKIISGEVEPGGRIVELEIAKELGISRAPVREAMRQIEQEGLVSYSTNKGCTVRVLSPDDAWEVFYLRCSLEKLSMQLCNGKISEQSFQIMEKALDEIIDADCKKDYNACYSSDEVIHGEIAKAGGMKKLFDLWNSMQGLNFALFLTAERVVNIERQYKRHLKLINVLRAGDYEESCKIINSHYLDTADKLYQRYPIEHMNKIEKNLIDGGTLI